MSTLRGGGSGPVRVAFIFLDFGQGGAQRVTLDLMGRLQPSLYAPHLICVRQAGHLAGAARHAGVPVTVLRRLESAWDLRTVWSLARTLRRLGIAIAHAPWYSRVWPYARLGALLSRTPVFVSLDQCRPETTRRRQVADRLLAPGSWFVAASRVDARRLGGEGVSASRVHVIHNGVDVERFAPGDRAVARRALGLPESEPVVVTPARFVPRKRHVDLLAAVPAILARQPAARFVLAGDGPTRQPIAALVRSAGLEDRVTLVGHQSDMPRLYAAADVVVLPSRLEGLPLVVLEAMASGRVVVAARAGGTPEAVDDGVTGHLVPPEAPLALASVVARVLADADERETMGARAREAAVTRFSSRRMAREFEALYDEWLS